jgi:SLOG cluster4 family
MLAWATVKLIDRRYLERTLVPGMNKGCPVEARHVPDRHHLAQSRHAGCQSRGLPRMRRQPCQPRQFRAAAGARHPHAGHDQFNWYFKDRQVAHPAFFEVVNAWRHRLATTTAMRNLFCYTQPNTHTSDASQANPFVSVPFATGIGEARNALIARASFCLIAIGDSLGTLSEVALGRHFGKTVIGLEGAAKIERVKRVASASDAAQCVAETILRP